MNYLFCFCGPKRAVIGQSFPLKQVNVCFHDGTVVSLAGIMLSDASCNFDVWYCGWDNVPNTDFKWTRNFGSTPSTATGPPGDHTTGLGECFSK